MSTDPFEKHRTDTLILLVGENPLPNYVAAHLLGKKQADGGKIVLLYTAGTSSTEPQRGRLHEVLAAEGFQVGQEAVKDNKPTAIYAVAERVCRSRNGGTIGLNYTGGTKTMAVHAYRGVFDQRGTDAVYSYLDDRRLAMVFDHTTPIQIQNAVPVTLNTLFELHLTGGVREIKTQPALPQTATALVQVYGQPNGAEEWRDWLKSGQLCSNSFATTIPFTAVREAFERERTKPENTYTKWFNGEWLEDYVLMQATSITDIHEWGCGMGIEAPIGKKQFEFDVAFMRGHQFFGISCTGETGEQNKAVLKQKLLEVSVRAKQLGGGAARFALVCGASEEKLRNLQLHDEFRDSPDGRRVKIFGRAHLANLQHELERWVAEVEEEAEKRFHEDNNQ